MKYIIMTLLFMLFSCTSGVENTFKTKVNIKKENLERSNLGGGNGKAIKETGNR